MARCENNHLALAFKIDAINQDCHQPIFLLETVNLYNNTVFRWDQACLIQRLTLW